MNFTDLELKEPILSAVSKAKYETPSPIQEKAIPVMLEGKDIIACAQTGTGKTAAFALPILNKLEYKKKHQIRALVLTPTRELAVQIFENFKKFGRYLKLRACCVYGGAPSGPQRKALRSGCDILIATPGRLNDFMVQGEIILSDIEVFVLDEADRMLDMGFIGDVRTIASRIPEVRQTVMFSATMPKEIKELANELLHDPVDIRVAPPASPAETITQYLVYCEKADKKHVLKDMLVSPEVTKAIVFTRTKIGADRLTKKLIEDGIKVLTIHGDKTQGQRQNALQRFRTNQVDVLVATDVAARGIDISDISHVFNYDLPEEDESYIHRIGRAGRAGKEGISISLCCHEELGLLASIEKMLKKEIPLMKTEYSIELKRKKASTSKSNGRRQFKKKTDTRNTSDKNKKRDINKREAGKRENSSKKRDSVASNKSIHKSTKLNKSRKPNDRKPRNQSKNYKPRKKNSGR
ncbi:DEAD/DEAH box helicase [uncultured Solobacterium sp.]|uniref:DEAD/DEAH box helicase n=1 Tax=uncultured Solobacterium sp. TaxID=747375 RepID=UPI0028D714BE|nr:DEAD/DEAH box helicase [uncultured Solobacterium sp.]